MSPSKVSNSTIKDLNYSEMNEISNNEPKRTMIWTANEIKEEMYKCVPIQREFKSIPELNMYDM
jgi:hypothetical protein